MLSETSRVGNCVHATTIMALPQPQKWPRSNQTSAMASASQATSETPDKVSAPAAIDESLDEFVCPITQEFPQPTALIFLATVLAKDSHGIAQPLRRGHSMYSFLFSCTAFSVDVVLNAQYM